MTKVISLDEARKAMQSPGESEWDREVRQSNEDADTQIALEDLLKLTAGKMGVALVHHADGRLYAHYTVSYEACADAEEIERLKREGEIITKALIEFLEGRLAVPRGGA